MALSEHTEQEQHHGQRHCCERRHHRGVGTGRDASLKVAARSMAIATLPPYAQCPD